MKKYVCLFLALCLCLSMAACAASEPQNSASTESGKYEKYELLLFFLEAGLYDDARAEFERLTQDDSNPTEDTEPAQTQPTTEPVQTEPEDTAPATTVPVETQPQETEPEWEMVEITLDNFFDYFKAAQMVHGDWNGFGELEQVNVDCYFVPRDGLELLVDECQLAMELKIGWANYEIIVDSQTQEVALGACLEGSSGFDDPYVVDFWYMGTPQGWYFNGRYAGLMTFSPDERTIWVPTSYIVTRAQGTITVRGTVTDDTGAKG